MALKGDRKRAYQRQYMPQYMRRRRAKARERVEAFIQGRLQALGFGTTSSSPDPTLVILPLHEEHTMNEVEQRIYQDWAAEQVA